jgi:hypothetical protein
MDDSETRQREEFLKLLQSSLQKAEAQTRKFRGLDTGLLVTNIVLGGLSAVLAGGIAVTGEPVTGALDVANVASGWQIICFLIAILAAATTVSGSIHKAFRITDRLAAAIACTSALRSLQLGVTVAATDIGSAVAEYKQLLREHPDILA